MDLSNINLQSTLRFKNKGTAAIYGFDDEDDFGVNAIDRSGNTLNCVCIYKIGNSKLTFWVNPSEMIDSPIFEQLNFDDYFKSMLKCECGSETAGYTTHSNWCPKHES